MLLWPLYPATNQKDLSHFWLWFNDTMGWAARQTLMTCQSGVLQTHRSTACHQMHLSERGDERAARLALKFKVTPCDCDSSPPRRGNRRKRWGERKNKENLLTFSSTHTDTHSYTKHVHQLEGPFINTYVNTARYKAMLVTPTGYYALDTRHPDYSQKSTMNVKVKEL